MRAITKNKKSKNQKNPHPVRALLWVGSFLFLFSFVILLPIYRSANLTPPQHLQEGLLALQKSDYASAKVHLLKAAQTNSAQAYFVLGTMEIQGKNNAHKANPMEAAFYFQKAAELGMKDAQYTLALLYDRGEGVPADKQKALDWGLLAAAQGDVNALYACAVWLERGYSGKPEPHQALALYEYAAAQGHINSMASLISIYSGGTDIPANQQRALYWKEQLEKVKASNPNQKQKK